MKPGSFCLFAAAAFALAGCPVAYESTPIPVRPPVEEDDPPPPGRCPLAASPLSCLVPDAPELATLAAAVLRDKCADCHGEGQSFGGLSDVLDADDLKSRRLIGASAEDSRFYQIAASRHQEGAVNPRTGRPVALPNERDLRALREWVDAGAKPLRGDRTPIALDAYRARLQADLARVPPADRAGVAYVEFHAVYNNNRYGNDELVALVNATLKLLNHLDARSTAANAAGGVGVVYDDYNVPLGVRFDAGRFNLDKQRDVVGTLARLANRHDPNAPFACGVPALPALDFLHVASSDDVLDPIAGTVESGYANVALRALLEGAGVLAPGQLVFEPVATAQFVQNGFTNVARVGVYDLLAAADPALNREALGRLYAEMPGPEALARACLTNSSAAAARRCVDRVARAGGPAAAYLSFDVPSAAGNAPNGDPLYNALFLGPANPPSDPLVPPRDGLQPFTASGGEGLFRLPNQMLGAFAFDANFRLLSNAPSYAALNAAAPEQSAHASIASCAYCHERFTIPFADVLMPAVLDSMRPTDFAEPPPVAPMAQGQDEWDATFAIDAEEYVSALRKVYLSNHDGSNPRDGVWALGAQYRRDLTPDDLVAELGLSDVSDLYDDVAWLVEPELSPVPRAQFITLYQQMVEQFGRGNEDFLRGCLARDANQLDAPVVPPPAGASVE